MEPQFAPPTTPPDAMADALRDHGYGVLAPDGLQSLLGGASLDPLAPSWDRLEPDQHLRDGGRYRLRRHSCFVLHAPPTAAWHVEQTPHRAHFQPVEYNALHGGIERSFAPMEAAVASSPAFQQLLRTLGALFASCQPVTQWYVEAHQFRIDTTGGIGRPTPEGAHRDGVDYVAVLLVHRAGIKGGESRVFDAQGPAGVRFTMLDPWTTLLLDDARVIHESTPIQPIAPGGHRDTLVLTFRAHGFQQRS